MVTTIVITWHLITYNTLFYNKINHHNFAPETEMDTVAGAIQEPKNEAEGQDTI